MRDEADAGHISPYAQPMAPPDRKKTMPAFGGAVGQPQGSGPESGPPAPRAAQTRTTLPTRDHPKADAVIPGLPPVPTEAAMSAGTPPTPESSQPASNRPGLEVQVHRAEGAPQPIERLSRRFLELWTRNSVYVLDVSLSCIRVYHPESRQQEEGHPFIGARLVGGQRNKDGVVEMSYPIPQPGSGAVFESTRAQKRLFTRTSAVERVVLHTSVISIADERRAPSWEVITDSP